MTSESRAAALDLHAVLTEIFPHHRSDPKKFSAELLATIVLFRREMQALRDDTKTFRKFQARYADGLEPRISVKTRKGPKE